MIKEMYKERIDVRDIFSNMWNGDLCNGMDIVIYYAAIEYYYHENIEGKNILNKISRVYPQDFMPYEKLKKFLIEYERFRNIQLPLVKISENFQVLQGNYRIALALYHEEWNVLCEIVTNDINKKWSKYEVLGIFSILEIDILERLSVKIKQLCDVTFIGVLWPSVKDYFDDIIDDIKWFAEVVDWYDISMSDYAFPYIIQMAYNIDDSTRWMIDKKIMAMKNQQKTIRIVKVKFKHIDYRFKYVRPECIKWVERKAVSKSVEQLKSFIRKSYKDKINYYFDIIIHMGDNWYQNQFMGTIFDFIHDFDKSMLAEGLMKRGMFLHGENWENDYCVGETLYVNNKKCLGDIIYISNYLAAFKGVIATYSNDSLNDIWDIKVCGYQLLKVILGK